LNFEYIILALPNLVVKIRHWLQSLHLLSSSILFSTFSLSLS